jgi:hypothetical protein
VEVVALLEKVGFVETFVEFLNFLMNSEEMLPIIYLDYTLVISLVTQRSSVTRIKHMRTSISLVREAAKGEK